MRESGDFTADAVIQLLIRGCVNETVSNPNARHHGFINFRDQLKRLFDAFTVIHLPRCECFRRRLKVVTKNEEASVTDDGHHLAGFTPDDILHRDIQSTNHAALIPIVEANEVHGANTEQSATVQTFGGEVRAERILFREVLEQLDLTRTFTNGELARIDAPREFNRTSKALISPRERGVNDVLAVSANGDESSVRIVRQTLRVEFTISEILHRQRQSLTVGDFVIRRQCLDVRRLHFVVFAPDDFTGAIHADDGLVTTDFEHHRAFIVTDRH